MTTTVTTELKNLLRWLATWASWAV